MAFKQTNDMSAKIDDKATDGLLGVVDSLSYRVMELERHFHSRERWFGISADQSGTDWALAGTLAPFVVTSGDNTWGAAAKILGTSDTPAIAGSVKYDPHRFLVTTVSVATIWKLQFIYGTGSAADAITADQYTDVYTGYDSANPTTLPRVPVDLHLDRLVCAADQLWCRGWNATNSATISIFVGIHEYEG